ncbi:PREDICTED: ly6/PLAUR domain-containing protein 6 [Cyprinodon variegatus]|uniref:LY6/PLAUR domain containing 6 n=1 Tax=Cyprinodon variegatus TaxID=28743 RepID=A0A3Q2DVP2_CYPVA|nr:PREDICTED: ly6/PLAUR domain-containing protein 6 [Cyprinodon variegatus]XP_015233919.1 PREDICTED: ly6/PLAUR domain-containing protein 6 [Cyprinodon variegatus]
MMEAWPAMAWILVLLSVSDWLTIAQGRDFTMKDIVRLHPSTTPHPGGFKCFTCQDAADNYECNRWAPDVYCPKDTGYCYTLHMMDNHGDSVSVTKRCSTLENCRFTGCINITHNGFQVCTSCCEGNICNVLVPRNDSSAMFSFATPLGSSGGRLLPAVLHLFPLVIISSCWTCLRVK